LEADSSTVQKKERTEKREMHSLILERIFLDSSILPEEKERNI
jgi:hypothetical protein